MKQKANKLPIGVQIGYGVGTAGDSISFTLFFTYFLFFMTDQAGVNPAVAGLISSASIIWMGICGPIIGYWSDNTKNPKGRRRPFMIGSIVPLALVLALLFQPYELSAQIAPIYYIAMTFILWTCYTAYSAPWASLGAELTQDYKARNNLRLVCGICAYPCIMIAQSGSIGLVTAFSIQGITPRMAWFLAVSACAAAMLIMGIVSWAKTKGREIVVPPDEGEKFRFSFKELFKQYGSLIKLKAFRSLIFFQVVYVIGYTMTTNSGVYMLNHLAKLTGGQQSFYWIVYGLLSVVCLPVVTAVANKFDKKVCILVFSACFAAISLIFYFTGINGPVEAYIFAVFIGLATSSFYGIFYSLIYDCCEVFELVTGDRREGGILALSQLIQAIGGAISTALLGFVLASYGYNEMGMGEVTAQGKTGILTSVTIIPAIFVAVSLLFLLRYRMTKVRYDAVMAAIEKKKEGIEPNLSDFSDLV
jgi:GPH family glycoside/pentoside/hexuronide:cation symporter